MEEFGSAEGTKKMLLTRLEQLFHIQHLPCMYLFLRIELLLGLARPRPDIVKSACTPSLEMHKYTQATPRGLVCEPPPRDLQQPESESAFPVMVLRRAPVPSFDGFSDTVRGTKR